MNRCKHCNDICPDFSDVCDGCFSWLNDYTLEDALAEDFYDDWNEEIEDDGTI